MERWRALKKIIFYYTWALKAAMREKRTWMLMILVSYVVISLSPNVELIVSKAILSRMESQEQYFPYVFILLGILLLVFISSDVGNVIYMLFYEKIRYSISNKLFERVMRRISRLSMDAYEKTENNEFLERLVSASRYDLHNLISSNMSFYATITQTLAYLAMIISASPVLALPMLLVAVIPYCYRMNEAKEKTDLDYELQGAGRRMEYLGKLMTEGKFLKELRLYGSFQKVHQKWQGTYGAAAQKRYGHFTKWNRRKFFYGCFGQILDIGILVLFVVMYYHNKINFSTLFFLWQCQANLNKSVGWFASIVPNSYEAVRRIEECLGFIEGALSEEKAEEETEGRSELSEKSDDSQAQKYGKKAVEENFGIRLSHVCYQYAEGGFSIKDVSLEIKQNQMIALLGENGSGKSTLIKLILGLYPCSSGEIRYIADGREQAAETFFGCAFQDYASYHLSLRENVGLGNLAAMKDDKKMQLHLWESNCQDIVDDVGGDLDATLGRLFDLKGKGLSGGQWQRLANARALYSERLALVFDEPTVRLDPIAELEQMEHIRKKLQGRTVILVSHRIGFARIADTICYMEDGRILESGSHDSLMSQQGRYYRLFRTQAQWYEGRDCGEQGKIPE